MPFEERDGNGYFTPTATNLSASHKFKKELSQKERAKAAKCLTVRRKEFVITHAHQKKQAVKRIKENLLPNIQKCIKDWFSTFSDPIFEAMCITDCFRWDYDDSNYGVKKIKIISGNFCQPLLEHKFKTDPASYELLAELIIAMETASSTEERGFSTTDRMLTNVRLCLSNVRLNNLLLLQINVPILITLDPNYESKLVDKTVDLCLNKQKCYHLPKSNTSTSKSLSSGITEKEDQSLQTPLNLTDHTPASMLFENDSHLQVSIMILMIIKVTTMILTEIRVKMKLQFQDVYRLLWNSTAYQAKFRIYIFIDYNASISFHLLLCSEKIIYCLSEIEIINGILMCSAKKNICDVFC